MCGFMNEASHKYFSAGGEVENVSLRLLMWMDGMETFQQPCQLRFVRPSGHMHLAEIPNNAIEVSLERAVLPSNGHSAK